MPPSQHPPSIVALAVMGLTALLTILASAASLPQDDLDQLVFLPFISGLTHSTAIFLPLAAKHSPAPAIPLNPFGLNVPSLAATGQLPPILDAGSDCLRYTVVTRRILEVVLPSDRRSESILMET